MPYFDYTEASGSERRMDDGCLVAHVAFVPRYTDPPSCAALTQRTFGILMLKLP